MADRNPELPKRVHGNNLPPTAYHAIGRAKMPDVIEDVWHLDEQTVQVLLNSLRRWQVSR